MTNLIKQNQHLLQHNQFMACIKEDWRITAEIWMLEAQHQKKRGDLLQEQVERLRRYLWKVGK